jgi:branched-chain amino acid transport system permease protein
VGSVALTAAAGTAARWARLPRASRELGALAAVVVAGLVFASVVPEFRAQEWTLWVLYGLLALSFTFIWGHGGIFSFGQAAFFGLGGYAYGVVAINLLPTTNETISAVVVAVGFAALAAAVLGYFIFYGNVGDVYVAIITLAFSLVLLTVVASTADPKYHLGDAPLGGYNGMVGIPPLTYGVPGGTALELTINEMFAASIVAATLVTFGVRWLLRRPFGRVVAALRENEPRTQLLGYDVRRYKLVTFVVGGAIAGLAGAGYAAWGTFINPSVFALQQAAFVAIWVLVGGRSSLLGAFVGVVVVQAITSALGGSGSTSTPIVLGAVLIAVVLLLPQGIVPTLAAWARRLVPALRPRTPPPAPAVPVADGALPVGGPRQGAPGDSDGDDGGLRAEGLVKRFGGVTAVDGVDAAFSRRGVHCLIGPNGAGKSTFFNLLVGRYPPTAGEVRFRGKRITRRRPDQRAQRGIGIKLQVASIYGRLSSFENLWLAAYARSRDARAATERAGLILEWLHLRDRAHEPAGVLSHGGQQWLEIGMVVAADPDVILLDEPTAGMTREETFRTADLVKALGERTAVIVVEHDMEFVRALDAPVTMFHEGQVFARGSLAELREDDRVLDVYLGRTSRVEA